MLRPSRRNRSSKSRHRPPRPPPRLAPVAASTAAIAGLRPGSGMASQLARAAVRGMGNQAVGRALARSALSDELSDVADTQGEAALIARLRTMNVSDPDVETMIESELSGDALTLGRLLVRYGDESMWPAPVEEYQTPFDDAPSPRPASGSS